MHKKNSNIIVILLLGLTMNTNTFTAKRHKKSHTIERQEARDEKDNAYYYQKTLAEEFLECPDTLYSRLENPSGNLNDDDKKVFLALINELQTINHHLVNDPRIIQLLRAVQTFNQT